MALVGVPRGDLGGTAGGASALRVLVLIYGEDNWGVEMHFFLEE